MHLIWPLVVIMTLINFDMPLSQVNLSEIQFIQLFTKHEMSLIYGPEVWWDLHPGAGKSLHCERPFVRLLLSSGSLFIRWIEPCLHLCAAHWPVPPCQIWRGHQYIWHFTSYISLTNLLLPSMHLFLEIAPDSTKCYPKAISKKKTLLLFYKRACGLL